MPNQNMNPFKNPLISFMLLLAASTPNPEERLGAMSQAINSMREAIGNINSGLDTFHTHVVPMFIYPPEQK